LHDQLSSTKGLIMNLGRMLSPVLFPLLAALCACSTQSPLEPDGRLGSDGQVAPDTGARSDLGAPEVPSIRFLDAKQQAVTSIYIDDPVTVQLAGLVPSREVTVTALMAPWKSSAVFKAAADGTVDTARDAPISGTYSGVDPDGLFWSMDTTQFEYAKSADVVFEAVQSGTPTLRATLVRTVTVPGITQIVPDDKGLVGVLVLPPGQGPFAGILAFGGSEGGISGGMGYAGELVPRGYAVLAVAYFGESGLPATLKEVPLEYFDKALDWFSKRPEIDGSRLAVIGGSRGGELSLLLAARRKDLKAAVADVPSGYVWGGTTAGAAGWTSAGQPLPYVPWHGHMGTTVAMPNGGTATASTPAFQDDIAKSTPAELEAARIRVEDSSTAIAMFAGADDQMWPSCQLAKVAMDQLTASGHAKAHPDELTCFEKAGHLISSVGLPTTWTMFTRSPSGTDYWALGGTPAGNAHAGRERQKRLLKFLERALKP